MATQNRRLEETFTYFIAKICDCRVFVGDCRMGFVVSNGDAKPSFGKDVHILEALWGCPSCCPVVLIVVVPFVHNPLISVPSVALHVLGGRFPFVHDEPEQWLGH